VDRRGAGSFDASSREGGVTSGVSQTQAETTKMAKTAEQFDTANSALTSTLNGLMADLAMLSSTWKGLAAGEFDKVKTQYAKDLGDLNRALADTAESIRVSGAGYDVSDSEAATRVTKSGGGGITLPL
jgi:WXG100 family type VII secretion target